MRKNLTCPWCGGPMKAGNLESQRFINWVPREEAAPDLRELLSWEGIKELCAPLTGNIQVPTQKGWENPYGQIPAWHCPECRVFLFDGKLKEQQKK